MVKRKKHSLLKTTTTAVVLLRSAVLSLTHSLETKLKVRETCQRKKVYKSNSKTTTSEKNIMAGYEMLGDNPILAKR